tara:strand:+ start:393 stop:623 length:231 start_codon:yes stop_codon:yes gene_type:complete
MTAMAMGHDIRQQGTGVGPGYGRPQHLCISASQSVAAKREAVSQHPGNLYENCTHRKQQLRAYPFFLSLYPADIIN